MVNKKVRSKKKKGQDRPKGNKTRRRIDEAVMIGHSGRPGKALEIFVSLRAGVIHRNRAVEFEIIERAYEFLQKLKEEARTQMSKAECRFEIGKLDKALEVAKEALETYKYLCDKEKIVLAESLIAKIKEKEKEMKEVKGNN